MEIGIDPSPNPKVIRAAGGIVWWRDSELWRVAVIHRPKHQDWSLPKGKLDMWESWEEAAIREVREETGCEIRLGAFAGLTSYLAQGRPKVVLFWNMERIGDCHFEPDGEVDRVEWLAYGEAIERLDHPSEKELLREVANGSRISP